MEPTRYWSGAAEYDAAADAPTLAYAANDATISNTVAIMESQLPWYGANDATADATADAANVTHAVRPTTAGSVRDATTATNGHDGTPATAPHDARAAPRTSFEPPMASRVQD